MADFKSNFRDRYHHPNVVVSMDADLEFGVPYIQSYFEDQIRRGTEFRAGETVQIGWMIVMLKADASGDLEIWEPRFGTVPIEWVRGVSNTYRQLMVQKTVGEQIGVEPMFPSLRQSAVVSPDFFSVRRICMLRSASQGADSGWVFSAGGDVREGGKVCSLFEIGGNRPDVIPFLALPAGASVVCADGEVEIQYGERVVNSNSNQFLKMLLRDY
ncbi:MAG TPA: hypothetical protein VJU59_23275 [Paraburkholderia sp.]|uniref:immunity protein Imm33 domain-containing protein n=1 Tax=Paraburkholderia sp. TaxID=1926495 RepID=UPI002B475828|nr:hypothetical protein [Paraburkholderia sp.]HKR42556.1 hypothetical protein [Paraburkholderia sp.]